MSKGPGRVQRAIIAAFEAHPDRAFPVTELATLAYCDRPIEKRHTDAVDRALRSLADDLGLRTCRARRHGGWGWRNVWALKTKRMPIRMPRSS